MRSIGMAVALVMALTSAATADPLDDAVGAALRSHHVVGAAVTVIYQKPNGGVLTVARGYGTEHLDNGPSNSPIVTNQTAFMLASVSKGFTGAAVSKLVDMGVITLDDDICDTTQQHGWSLQACRNPEYPNLPITWRHLVTHTSGFVDLYPFVRLNNGDSIEAAYGPDRGYGGDARGNPECPLDGLQAFYGDILQDRAPESALGAGIARQVSGQLQSGNRLNWRQIFATAPAEDFTCQAAGTAPWCQHAPGTVNHYSNLGAGLVGALVEMAAPGDVSFAEFCRDHLFAPLGMSSTAWHSQDLPTGTRQAMPMTYRAGRGTHSNVGDYCFIDFPSGSLRTTAADLVAWGTAMLARGAPLWSDATGQQAFECQMPCRETASFNSCCRTDGASVFWTTYENRHKRDHQDPTDTADYWSEIVEHDWTGCVWHNGGEMGVATLMLACPDAGVFASVLTNTGGNSGTAAEQIMKAVLRAAKSMPGNGGPSPPPTVQPTNPPSTGTPTSLLPTGRPTIPPITGSPTISRPTSPPSTGNPTPPPSTDAGVLFVGDSDIEYWATAETFPGSVNVGVGGYTCRNVLNRIDGYLSTHTPTTVVLVCGENDLWGATVATTFSRFSQVVASITATGAQVIYMGTKPEPDTTSLHAAYRQYDALIRGLATDLSAAAPSSSPPPLVMVDVYPAFESLGNPSSLYRNDDLHLSSSGYAHWSTWARTALAAAAGNCHLWESNTCTAGNDAPTSPPSIGAPTTTRRPTSPPSTGAPTTRRPTSPPSTHAPTIENGNECPTGFTESMSRPTWPRLFNGALGFTDCVAQCEQRQDCTGLRWNTGNRRCQTFGGLDTRSSSGRWKNCVRDVSSTSTSTSTTTSTDLDNGGEVSDRSCHDLGWPAAVSNSDTCGESNAGWSCSRSSTQQVAADTCLAAGARLCTERDVLDRAGSGTGCGLNSRHVWTATRCTTSAGAEGRVTVNQNSGTTTCNVLRERSGIRCCADGSARPRTKAADATTELYSGSDDNYEVPLPAAGQAMIHPGTGDVMNAAATAADGEPDMAAESTKE